MSATRREQGGYVMLIVMIAMTTLSLIASVLLDHLLENETTEVDRSLADVRVYWSMAGHGEYVLSRVLGEIDRRHLDGASTPSFQDVQVAMAGAISMDEPFNVDCAVTAVATEILRCLMEELDTDDAGNSRDWNYGGAYTLRINQESWNNGRITLRPVEVANVVRILQGVERWTPALRLKPVLEGVDATTAAIKLTAYDRAL